MQKSLNDGFGHKKENNLTEFSTWGGCSSRAIFNSRLSPGYKNLFHINFSVEGGSLISLMSDPIDFDKKLLTGPKPFSNLCVEHDFSKTYLKFLKEDNIDYLLMDTSFDLTGLLILSNGCYVTDTNRLHETKLFDTLEIERRITYLHNSKEFLKLWKKSCKLFFKYINTYCDNLKIILNGSRWVYKYYDNGNVVVHEKFRKKSENRNKFRDILDSHILETYDVDYLPFNENSLIDKNHIFGLGPAHYNSDYYTEKIKQLTEIVNRDKLLEGSLSNINFNFRKLKRENAILKLKLENSLDVSKKDKKDKKDKKVKKDKKDSTKDVSKMTKEDKVLDSSKDVSKKVKKDKKDSSKDVSKKAKEDKVLDSSKDVIKKVKKDKWIDYSQDLKKYVTARLDLKNKGNESNSIKILSISDDSNVKYHNWLKNKDGQGVIIHSFQGKLDLNIKCINDGILNIYLRGIDIKDKNGIRFPIYIDFKRVIINGKDYLERNKLVSHDDHHVIKKEVKSSDVLKIYVEWAPFTENSYYECD